MWNSQNPRDFHRNNLDFCRFALSTLVLFSHCFPILRGTNATEPLYRLTGSTTIGDLAVDGFFILSGFLVAESWTRSAGAVDFIKRRGRRIYPAFVVMMLLQAFVLAPLVSPEATGFYNGKQLAILAANTAFLTQYSYPYGGLLPVFPHNPVPLELNNSLWTIRYEFTCYLALALAGVTGLLRRPRLLAALFVTVLALHAFQVRLPSHKVVTALVGDVAYWPRFAAYFLAGVVFHGFRLRIPHTSWLALGCAVALALALAWPRLLPVMLPLAGTYLLFWFGFHPGIPLSTFGRRGDFSYGIYLYAWPVQQTLVYVLGSSMAPVTLMALAWPVTLGLAILSWHAVEKRLLKSRLPPSAPGAALAAVPEISGGPAT